MKKVINILWIFWGAALTLQMTSCGRTEKGGWLDSLRWAKVEAEEHQRLEADIAKLEERKVRDEYSGKMWNYSEEEDLMDGGKKRWATLQSDNYINMDFPYQGNTYAKLTVRYMKKYGTDVIVEIDRGQFGGNKYKGTNYVRVKFDDAAPVKYTYNEAADGSTEMVFLKNAKGFISRAKKAKKLKVEVPLYQEGNRVFDFEVDSCLVW